MEILQRRLSQKLGPTFTRCGTCSLLFLRFAFTLSLYQVLVGEIDLRA